MSIALMICITTRTIKSDALLGEQQVSVAKGSKLKIVLATLSRNTYSGWSLFIEGKPLSSQISEVTLDRSVSHFELTRSATQRLNALAAATNDIIELYVVDERQRGGFNHPSVTSKLASNIKVQKESPSDTLIRRARSVIADEYHKAVQATPFDGDPGTPFLIATAVKLHPQHHAASAFGLDAAGTGVVLAAAGDVHTGRSIVRVPRNDSVIAELIAIHAGLMLAMKNLPSFRSTREHAVVCTTSKEALDAIAYPWGGSKARRLAAGKIIELLNKIKCGDKRDRYGAIFRLISEEDAISYHEAAKELAGIAIEDYAAVVEHGKFYRRNSSLLDKDEKAIQRKLLAELAGVEPQPYKEVIPDLPAPTVSPMPLFHYPAGDRKKTTL